MPISEGTIDSQNGVHQTTRRIVNSSQSGRCYTLQPVQRKSIQLSPMRNENDIGVLIDDHGNDHGDTNGNDHGDIHGNVMDMRMASTRFGPLRHIPENLLSQNFGAEQPERRQVTTILTAKQKWIEQRQFNRFICLFIFVSSYYHTFPKQSTTFAAFAVFFLM